MSPLTLRSSRAAATGLAVASGLLMLASAASALAQAAPNPFPTLPPQQPAPAPPSLPKPPPIPAAPAGGSETAPTSRSLVEAATALSASGFGEASLRAATGLSTRMSFTVARASVALQSSADAAAPRRAFGPNGGVAFLAKLPVMKAALGSSDPKSDPVYVLATVTGTKIKVWAVYTDVPADDVLSRRMIAAFAGIGAPLMTFDPTFTPGPGVGGERYALK